MDAYSGGWLLYVCQQQMPGPVASTRHTLKHDTAAFSASGCWVEKEWRVRSKIREQEKRHRNERERSGGRLWREKQKEHQGRRRGEREREETKADTDNIYQHSRNMGWVYHYK